jgi:hypothetical protein
VHTDQFLALLWLRWRLTLNGLRRHGTVNYILSLLVVGAGFVLSVVGAVGGVAGGWLGLSGASPRTCLLTWDIVAGLFLVFWVLGLLTQLQRSEIIDLRRLLHLPLSLRGAFLLNYASSLAAPSILCFLPGMLGLALGQVLGGGARFLLLLPLVLGFFFAVSAWTYCLQGWLAMLMENPRRRRAVVVTMTMILVLLFQIPNLFNTFAADRPRHGAAHATASPRVAAEAWCTAEQVHAVVPLAWLPLGAHALAAGRTWPAAAGALGLTLLGSWGFLRAYRATVRHYRGDAGSVQTAVAGRREPVACGGRLFVEQRVPFVPEEAGAMAVTGLRALLRAPEVRMALVMNTFIMLLLGVMNLMRRDVAISAGMRPFIACGAASFTFLGMSNLMTNHFGFDRSGFRALVLLPAPRRSLLLGKNLALLPLAACTHLILLALAALLARLGVTEVLLSVLSFGTMFAIYSALGNVTSVLVPYRIPAGAMKGRSVKGVTALLMVVFALGMSALGGVIFLPPLLGYACGQAGTAAHATVTLTSATALAGMAALCYWRSLAPVGRLLQAREQAILEVVTREND